MQSTLPRIPMTGILALAVFATAMASTRAVAEQDDPTTTLWYTTPARIWSREALPIGNGRIGAMVFGKVGHERIALNEETVWSGMQTNWNRPDANENLPKIRELLLAGRNDEAEAMVNETFTCTGGGSRGGENGPWGWLPGARQPEHRLGIRRRVPAAERVEVPHGDHAGYHGHPRASR